MIVIQVVIDVPVLTKAEYMRRTGLSGATFKRQQDDGDIIIMKKKSKSSSVMVNVLAMLKKSTMEAASSDIEKEFHLSGPE